jgi:hypothetical protein
MWRREIQQIHHGGRKIFVNCSFRAHGLAEQGEESCKVGCWGELRVLVAKGIFDGRYDQRRLDLAREQVVKLESKQATHLMLALKLGLLDLFKLLRQRHLCLTAILSTGNFSPKKINRGAVWTGPMKF